MSPIEPLGTDHIDLCYQHGKVLHFGLSEAAPQTIRRAADAIELAPAQLERLNALRPAAGARHDDANRASIDQ